jgi:hypothetical protein
MRPLSFAPLCQALLKIQHNHDVAITVPIGIPVFLL